MKKNSFLADRLFEANVLEFLEKSSQWDSLDVKEVVSDKEKQLKGTDYIMNDGTKVDIKSVASINLPTFCFELENTSSNKLGWFVNPEVETDAYLLTYHKVSHPDATGSYDNDKVLLTPNNISKTRLIYITKDSVKRLLNEELHFNTDVDTALDMLVKYVKKHIKDVNKTVRYALNPNSNEKIVDITNQKGWWENIKLVYTGNHNEHPINVVIPRFLLEKYAESVITF